MKKMSLKVVVVLIVAAVILIFAVTNLAYAQANRYGSASTQGIDLVDRPYPNPCLDPYPDPYDCDFLPSVLNLTEAIGTFFGD